jgi:aspartyl protease family protein
MPGTISAALLALAAGAIWLSGEASVAGFPAGEAIPLLLLGAAILWLTGWAVERAQGGLRDAIGAVAMWAIFVASAGAVYFKREEAVEGLRSFAEELGYGNAGGAVVSEGGEVTVTRRRDGHFRFDMSVNGKAAPFMFDTGASSVVLTAETAKMLGFHEENLRFVAPVQTANGRTMTAPVVLDRLSIGSIGFTRVPALVAKPGLLNDNLLGQTVLGRLESYEVRGNRLVLRARKG